MRNALKISLFITAFLSLVIFSSCGYIAEAGLRGWRGNDRQFIRKRNSRLPDAVYTYRTIDGLNLEGDFYAPRTGEPPYPVVVLIHGGGWRSGDKRGMAPYARNLLASGYACFSINYRLTPEGRFPNNVTDCKAAVQWLRRWSKRLGIDPDRIAAWGGSAGGHLSAFIGATDDDDGFNADEFNTSGRVQAVVPFYGIFDFTHFDFERERLKQYSYIYPRGGYNIESHLANISPATYVTSDDPPVFLVHGIEDSLVPVEQSENYYKLLQENGIRSELLLVEGAGHGLKPVDGMNISPTWEAVVASAIEFLDDAL